MRIYRCVHGRVYMQYVIILLRVSCNLEAEINWDLVIPAVSLYTNKLCKSDGQVPFY